MTVFVEIKKLTDRNDGRKCVFEGSKGLLCHSLRLKTLSVSMNAQFKTITSSNQQN